MKFKLASLGVAISAATFALTVNQASSQELTFGNYLPPNHLTNVHGLRPLFERLSKSSDSATNWKLFPGGQLFSAKATLASVSNRVADAGLIVIVFFYSDLKHAAIIGDHAFAHPDALAHNAAGIETMLIDCKECSEDYKKRNAIYLGGFGTMEMNLMCKPNVTTIESLKGRKVRTAGAQGRIAKEMGAVPVNIVMAEAVDAIQRGAIECVMGPLQWLVAYPGLDEIMEHVVDYPLGATAGHGLFVMNRNTWNGLSLAQKTTILREMPATTAQTMFDGYLGDGKRALAAARKRNISIKKGGNDFDDFMKGFRVRDRQTVIDRAKKRGVGNAEKIVEAMDRNAEKWGKIMARIGRDRDAYAKALWDEVYSKLDPSKL